MKTFTARQPIFNRKKSVVAYELLFREDHNNRFPSHMPDIQATSKLLLNAFFDTNISKITNNKPALVNFPFQVLKDKFAELLPTKDIFIEILETVEPNEELFSIMRRMFHKGYRFALDDFEYTPEWDRFLPFVKLVKFDILNTPLNELQPIIDIMKKRKIKILAEKVETNEEFLEAKKMGFDFFQGFFFAKPEMIIESAIPPSQTVLMALYRECLKEDIDFDKVKKYVEVDVSISYKLLRYVNNSGLFKHKSYITSIKEAVIYIGQDLMRRFVFLIVTAELSVKKPFELMKKALERAYFCESLAKNSDLFQFSDRAFLIGLFSVLDAILDRKMSNIVEDLPLEEDMKKALVDKIGLYSAFIKIAINYDHGNWDNVKLLTKQLGITENRTTEIYIQSIEWSDKQSNILS
jgi:EAL and modified HD-GYP domain-containing signal transduction protein